MDTGFPVSSWNLYVDGKGTGLIIKSPQGERHEYALKFMFKVPNNEAECEALIAGVELCYIAAMDLV